MARRIVTVSICLVAMLLTPSFLSAERFFKDQAYRTQLPNTVLTTIAVADVNGDGHGDLLVANGGVGVLLGHGDGSFGPVTTYISNVAAIAVGDFNGDGKVDVVASGTTVRVLLGNGDGTFQSPIEIDPGTFGPIVLGDVNGDGKLDVVASNGATVGVWLGKGDGTFEAGQYFTPAGEAPAIALGDVNGDGRA